jgi:hypothetical protein
MVKFKGIIHTNYHPSILSRYNQGESSIKIAKDYNVNYETILKIIRFYKNPIRKCGKSNKIYHFNENYFEKINSEDKAYFLGFVLADGYVSKNGLTISLQLADKHILEEFIKHINGNNKILEYHNKNSTYGKQSYCRLDLNSQKIKNDLNILGLNNNKTNIVSVPDIPQNLKHHFWRGVMDGDGWISLYKTTPKYINNKTKKITFYREKLICEVGLCGHINTINSFSIFLQENGLSHNRINKIKSIFRVKIMKDNLKFLDLIYSDYNTDLCLKRKYSKYLEYSKYFKNKLQVVSF